MGKQGNGVIKIVVGVKDNTMTAREYKKLDNVLFYGISQARASNREFQEMENISDPIKNHVLELQAQNHRGSAEGIRYALTTLNYRRPDMEILSKELG